MDLYQVCKIYKIVYMDLDVSIIIGGCLQSPNCLAAFIEIRKGRNNVGRGLSGYGSQKRKHSQHSDSFKGAFRAIKSGVV